MSVLCHGYSNCRLHAGQVQLDAAWAPANHSASIALSNVEVSQIWVGADLGWYSCVKAPFRVGSQSATMDVFFYYCHLH